MNQAEVVWKAQEDVDETVKHLRETQGAWMIDWLRLARTTAGASGNVTTGTLTERSANTWAYAPGSQPLRIVRVNGFSFSIIVAQVVGSIQSSSFPTGNERLIGTFDLGTSALKVDLAENAAAFDGAYVDDAGVKTTVHVKESGTHDSWPDGSAYRLFTSRSTSGTVTRDATTVAFSVTHTLESCSGACTGLSMRLYLDHEVTVTSASGVWNLKYLTGFQQPVGQLPTYTWTGTIWSGSNEAGGLAKRRVGALTELNVFLGASVYRVRTVTEP